MSSNLIHTTVGRRHKDSVASKVNFVCTAIERKSTPIEIKIGLERYTDILIFYR